MDVQRALNEDAGMPHTMNRRALLLSPLLLGLAVPARAATGELVLYTSQPDDIAAQTVAAFAAANPGVHVQVFRSGTTEIMSRLAAEMLAGAPKPDVLLIADAMSMELLKRDGHLMAYPQADVSAFPAAAYDPDRTYFGTKLITTGIIVNTKATAKPASWADLLKLQGVVLPSPLYSGAAMINVGAITEDPALGPGWLKQLAADKAVAVQGNGAVLTAVAGGQNMVGIIVDFMALNAARKGSPVSFVFPSEGVTAVTEPMAILKTAHNPDAARAFIDFLLSKDGQALTSRQGFLPARRDVTPPPGYPPVAEIKILPQDIPRIMRDSTQIKQNFADLFGG
jgi:iron(III) transport system substrate-binding protein